MDARTAELIMAAKGAVVVLAEITKSAGKPLTQCPSLIRLNAAILAVEATPAARDGGRFDLEDADA